MKKTFSLLQEELNAILDQLQSDDIDIDDALELYKRGEAVIADLEAYLTEAKNEIEHLKK